MSWQDDGSGNLVFVDDGIGNPNTGDTSGGTTDTSGGTTDYSNNPNYNASGISGWGFDITKSTDSSGNTVYTQSNGSSVTMKPNGDVLVNGELFGNTNTSGMGTLDTSIGSTLSGLLGTLGTGSLNAVKGLITNSKGQVDLSKLAGLAGGVLGGLSGNSSWFNTQSPKTGYQGGIPTYTAVREQVPGTYDPNRRPGSRGQEYFTQQQFVAPSDAATARATAAQQAAEAEARNKARTAQPQPTQPYAAGGIANLARGTYLAGATDGMADKIPATIENKQPAKLSHGEFVVPADVVSHLGNGNSDAGAQRLYGMMDKVRKARTGTTKQGKQINPNKFMPG